MDVIGQLHALSGTICIEDRIGPRPQYGQMKKLFDSISRTSE